MNAEYSERILSGVDSRIRAHGELSELIMEAGGWVLPGTKWNFLPSGGRAYFALHPGHAKAKFATLREAREHAHKMGDAPSAQTDIDLRWRPTNIQLDVARKIMATGPGFTSIVMPVVTPGKRQGVWTIGQAVLGLPSYYLVRDDDDYGDARNAASAVGEQYLRDRHEAEGGTYAYVRVEPEFPPNQGHRGVCWSVFEDGAVEPR